MVTLFLKIYFLKGSLCKKLLFLNNDNNNVLDLYS